MAAKKTYIHKLPPSSLGNESSYPLWQTSYGKTTRRFTSRKAARTWVRQQKHKTLMARKASAARKALAAEKAL